MARTYPWFRGILNRCFQSVWLAGKIWLRSALKIKYSLTRRVRNLSALPFFGRAIATVCDGVVYYF
jgi:hypothetical protein